ncbi:MAG: response regulator [Labilithrix sp.]|nr:response regulator [Labilithrix sp.]
MGEETGDLRVQVEQLTELGDRLLQEQQRCRELFAVAPFAHFITDRHGVITDVNAAACRAVAMDVRVIRTRPLAAFVESGDLPAFRAMLASLEPHVTKSTEIRLCSRVGRVFWAELRACASRSGEHVLWAARDIAEQRETAALLQGTASELESRVAFRTEELTRALLDKDELLARERELREQLEAANRAKDRFLAILSHDLRGPLNAVLGWTSLLRRELLDIATRDKALATIERNARIQAELIDGLLDVSRITAGKMQLDLQALDLGLIARGVLEAVTPSAREKGVALADELGDAAAPILGDAGRLRQVISNLLGNAVKFTPSGGEIRLRIALEGPSVRLIVSDTGRGIAADVLPHVFECFKQGGDPTIGRAGLGLGLFIVRHLVEMHGGTVSAESAGEGRGATFTVTIPMRKGLVAAPLDKAGLPQALEDVELEGVRVLLVEDEVDTRDILAMTLRRHGADVVTAADAETAVQVFAAFAPDVIVSDIGLPFADGNELIKLVRSSPQGREVAAIAVSGYASTDDAQRALEAGFDGHIPKPLSSSDLLDAIGGVMRAKK